jgi:hypothetical protein
MSINRNRPGPIRAGHRNTFVLSVALGLSIACSESDKAPNGASAPDAEEPFKSVEAVANAPGAFSSPRAGVPLADGGLIFIATLEGALSSDAREAGERIAILRASAQGAAPRVLYSGDLLVNPLDIAISVDEKTLYIADPAAGADGDGAILSLASTGGEPVELVRGHTPRAVTVADDGALFFSGNHPETREPGVFELTGGAALSVFTGAPLVDPSGIAVQRDGTLLVADTRLFDANPSVGSEAGIVRIRGGRADIFASGFATGYPAGIALTRNEKTLIVSGEGADRSDTVFLVDMANPSAEAKGVTASFSKFQDASAGLKRAHDSDTFIWASLAADGGTVFRIVAN